MIPMPSPNLMGDAVRVVAHGEVIAFRDNVLLHGGEQLLPVRLESQRIVALSKNREERQPSKRTGKRTRQLLVQRGAAARLAQIVMKRADTVGDSRLIRLTTACVEMTADAKRRGCDARKEIRRDVN